MYGAAISNNGFYVYGRRDFASGLFLDLRTSENVSSFPLPDLGNSFALFVEDWIIHAGNTYGLMFIRYHVTFL